MKILVVGGTGMLGKPVADRLAKDGYEVRVLTHSPEKAKIMFGSEIELAAGDVFFDGNPFIGSGLLDLVAKYGGDCLSVFLSPLSRDEIVELKSPERNICLSDFVAQQEAVALPHMIQQLLHRRFGNSEFRREARVRDIVSLRS